MNTGYPLILTLPLWRTLYRILPHHPIFWQKILRRRTPPKRKRSRWDRARRFLAVFFAMTLAIPVMALLSFPAALLVVMLILFGGLVSGIQTALGVSAVISTEYQLGRGELLALMPHGTVGLCWALSARHIRTDKTSLRLRRVIMVGFLFAAISTAVMGLAFVVSLLLIASEPSSADVSLLDLFAPLFNAVIVLAVLYIDLIQSTILGAVAGMLASVALRERSAAMWLAAALFLLEQLGFYVFVALVIRAGYLEVLPVGSLPLIIIQAGSILLVRELIMHGALRLAMRALNTDWRELITLPALRT